MPAQTKTARFCCDQCHMSFVCAPMEFRETVLTQRLGIEDHATARREIERND
jgi:hypothetical protein